MTVPLVAAPVHLPTRVGTHLARAGTDAVHLLDAVASLIVDPPTLGGWLRSLIDDPRSASPIAKESYWHVNGFAKLVLHSEPSHRVRLHVWPEGPGPRGETDPHSHRWDFASAVVAGPGLLVTEFQEGRPGLPIVRYRYTGGATRNSLSCDGDASLREVSRREIGTFDTYATDIRAVHTVGPLSSAMTATLVVQGPHRTDSTRVYRVAGAPDESRSEPLDELDVRLLLAEVIAAIPDGKGVPGR
ncbi:MAG TPA: hypothetical protein VM367_10260 [Pseudonocardia sp.]|nr:hypothetical protein [Pseudonocardia sp.]